MAQFSVSVDGIEGVLKKMDAIAGRRMLNEIDKVTETYARKMANDSASMAPVKTSQLRNSITASPKRVSSGVWQWGSNLEYARRQEYEHATKKAFIRNSIWMNQDAYRNAVIRKIAEGGR